MLRNGRLHEQTVDLLVGIELFDEREDVGLGGVCREPLVDRPHPHLGRVLVLEGHVHVGGRVVADQDRGEPERAELLDLLRDFGADLLGERLPVHERGCHGA